MGEIKKLQERVISFRDARDWEQFHNPKDVAISLSLEAAELLEHFQWKSSTEIKEYLKTNKGEVSDEIIDVLYWLLLLAYDLDVDIQSAFDRKMKSNAAKYPVKKAKSRHNKYTEL